MTTKLSILFFSTLVDVVGSDSIERAIDHEEGGLDVAALLAALYTEFPELAAWDRQILVSADYDWVDRKTVLRDGQEIGIMPPVQGG